MLTIRKIALLLSGLYLLLLFIGIVATRYFWFYPKELDNISHLQQQEIASIAGLLTQELNQQLAITIDYAEWDDTYAYVQQPSGYYHSTNLIAETYANLGLTGGLILNRAGAVLASQRLRSDSETLDNGRTPLSEWALQLYQQGKLKQISGTAGLYDLEGELYIISIADITNSDGSLPSNGYFFFARKLADFFWQNIRDIIRVDFAISRFIPPQCADITASVTEHQPTITRCLHDLFGNPVLAVATNIPTERLPQLMPAEIYLTYLVVAVIPALLYLVFLKLVTEPLMQATRHMRNSVIISPLPELNTMGVRIKELHELRQNFNRLIERVRTQQFELTKLSMTDKLTGIGNRRAFEEKLQQTWRRSMRHQDNVALILVDIDYFKRFNDCYGHQAGDLALQQVAQALAECVQRQDEDTFRYGGEEFIMICYVQDAVELENLRERIQQSISNLKIPHQKSSVASQLTVSYGIAWLLNTGNWQQSLSQEHWIKVADAALYEAKASGRNTGMLQIISEEVSFTGTPVLEKSQPEP